MDIEVTDKIKLIQLTASDAFSIYNLVEQSRDELSEYLYWVKDVIDPETAKNYISQRINSGLSGASWFKIQFNSNDCGVFAIKSICDTTGLAELGYWLSHHFYKKGIMTSIVKNLPHYLKQNTNAKIIEFRCLEENLASINIAQKSGAVLVNSLPNYMEIANSNQKLNIYQRRI
ncbi:GNAT family N-acetyltransferase [Pseudoalteromonas sp. C2R02]|uniref:GNAT family N-acetyltransferase n=1 Tax=Pseudoalteromonas sp. C2R02 TaxID=2841565 RepID=UPI001C0989D6|nr:GNAT family N-acetyltransferase [Pseudoalteromonas sp. C2R02]MBU2970836.1 GNAT family N-acetyltransferase [Pseudoalteromonas sp. C2R02]